MNQLSSWIIQKDPQTNKLLFESLNLFTILITYCSNKNIAYTWNAMVMTKNQHRSGLMIIPPYIDKKWFPASPLGPEWGKPDWTLRWQTQPANEYHQGEVEMITIQPAQRRSHQKRQTWTLQQTEKSKRNVKFKKRIHLSLWVANLLLTKPIHSLEIA